MDTAFAVTDEMLADIAALDGEDDDAIIRRASRYQKAQASKWLELAYGRTPSKHELAEELRVALETPPIW